MAASPLERSPFVAAAQAQDALWAYEKSGNPADLRRAVQAVIEAVDALALRQAVLPSPPWARRCWANFTYRVARWRRYVGEAWQARRYRRVAARDRVRQVRAVLASTAPSAQWDPPHDPARGGPCWCPSPGPAPLQRRGAHGAVCTERRTALGIRPPPALFWWMRGRSAP